MQNKAKNQLTFNYNFIVGQKKNLKITPFRKVIYNNSLLNV